MSIVSELQDYIDHWTMLTGCPPSSIPIDQDDTRRIWVEMQKMQLFPCDEESVPSFRGCDLYYSDDAKAIRNQTIRCK